MNEGPLENRWVWPSRAQIIIGTLILAVFGGLLFARLGYYALWDDESLTALTGENVWKTGDTSEVFGHNILAYRQGLLIRNLHDRSSPPLQFYVEAPFVGIFGRSALAARLPFALLGFASVILMLLWLARLRASTLAWVVTGMAIIGNISLILYCRQCRYYGLMIALAVAATYVYFSNAGRKAVIALSAIMLLLMASNYIAYGGLGLMLAADYLIWRRKERWLNIGDLLILLLPQLIVGLLLLHVFNPFHIKSEYVPPSWIKDRATLLWWHLRDLNACEYGPGLLLIAAPFVGIFFRKPWLYRATLALLVGVVLTAIVSPGDTLGTTTADVRYMAWLIPLCIAIAAGTIVTLSAKKWWIAIPLAAVAFGSNTLNLGFLQWFGWRSTPVSYVRELFNPADNVYAATADWINQHVADNQSILALPDYTPYPLMFLAPKAVYAWQLSPKQLNDPDYKGLPPIDFIGRERPDFVVSFGGAWQSVNGLTQMYSLVGVVNMYGADTYRPELFWRSFGPVRPLDPQRNEIYIFQERDELAPPTPHESYLHL